MDVAANARGALAAGRFLNTPTKTKAPTSATTRRPLDTWVGCVGGALRGACFGRCLRWPIVAPVVLLFVLLRPYAQLAEARNSKRMQIVERRPGPSTPGIMSELCGGAGDDDFRSEVLRCTPEVGKLHNRSCVLHNLYELDAGPGRATFTAFVVDGPEERGAAEQFEELHGSLLSFGRHEADAFEIGIKRFKTYGELVAAARRAVVRPGLTAFFTSGCPHDIGHALFDGLYPAMAGLARLGLGRTEPVHLLGRILSTVNGYRQAIVMFEAGALASEGGSYEEWKAPEGKEVRRYEMFAVGSGHMSQRTIAANCRMAGGEFAFRFLRDRFWRGARLDEKDALLSRCEPEPLVDVVIIQNKRHSPAEREAIKNVPEFLENIGPYGTRRAKVTYLSWQDVPDMMKEQMPLLAKMHVYVSGPGTGIMYHPMLRDGSVLVNLGQQYLLQGYEPTANRSKLTRAFGYMEEYMAGGLPYQRALHYDRCKFPVLETNALVDIIRKAASLVCVAPDDVALKGFDNRSPIGRAFAELWTEVKADDPRKSALSTGPSNDCNWAEYVAWEYHGCKAVRDKHPTALASSKIAAVRKKHGIYQYNNTNFDRGNPTIKWAKTPEDVKYGTCDAALGWMLAPQAGNSKAKNWEMQRYRDLGLVNGARGSILAFLAEKEGKICRPR